MSMCSYIELQQPVDFDPAHFGIGVARVFGSACGSLIDSSCIRME